jgi:ferredoxin-NADP reductase
LTQPVNWLRRLKPASIRRVGIPLPLPMERPTIAAQLVSKYPLSESTQTFHFVFKVPTLGEFNFVPGQFVSLVAPDPAGKSQTRAYSIASAPRGNEFDLCVNRVDGGFFSNLLADMEPGDTVQMHGPHGLFTLRQPLVDGILVATGTGIAPMLGFVQWAFPENAPPRFPAGKKMWLVYGTRHETEIYYRHYFEKVSAEHTASFQYLATLSRPHEGWEGLRGYVQTHIPRILTERAGGVLAFAPVEPEPPQHPEGSLSENPRQPTPDSFDIHSYICGLNDMVSATRDQLKELGWHRKQIVFERYD